MFISCKCGIETKSFYELEDKKKISKSVPNIFYLFLHKMVNKKLYINRFVILISTLVRARSLSVI